MKNFKTICALFLLTGNYASGQNSNLNVEKVNSDSKQINVAVIQQFSLFDVEGRPLTGKLKKYHDDYVRKHKSKDVQPSLKPTPILYDKVVDLTKFYKSIITQSELTNGKINFRDTIQLKCYISSKGKVTGYALMGASQTGYDEKASRYKEIIKETSYIETWSPAYFGETPGDVSATIQIIISDL